jgi:hypothetical protein
MKINNLSNQKRVLLNKLRSYLCIERKNDWIPYSSYEECL